MSAVQDPAILQEEDTDNGHLHIEATEDKEGIVLHECLDDGHGGMEYAYMGRLSLDAWRTLAEMFLLRHPQSARAMVAKWQTLLDQRPREEA